MPELTYLLAIPATILVYALSQAFLANALAARALQHIHEKHYHEAHGLRKAAIEIYEQNIRIANAATVLALIIALASGISALVQHFLGGGG